ncbi:MAG: benzoyl-CoA 2,3-epoxidase subunit BoxB [Rhodospirillaceae bacterium]|nr:benzoyl-CoA 2,3-epoxidase subunit BoxB [Rhodospirillaceae bacterium]|tara:strand:- start:9818 stop:11242 length:1425 start_codon:yes stop_codon:yes gene_type:complete
MSIDLNARIPNNVDLAEDRRLQRALESWQPSFINWWKELGPEGTLNYDVYLRTAVSVEAQGWAHFGYVKMPDYRWGIFVAPPVEGRTIPFGEHKGQPVWDEVPGEYRSSLRRLIVTQGDTEPASVEQQRLLGLTAPSLYDLRNLFQVNCEEGRHLWAMVYLLHAYFGRDGREEAEMMLERHSGDVDKPRILGAFNEETPDWLSYFMFTFFTDRDGKYQLSSLAESGFDPLARTCQFMLTEEAHHMFIGTTGIMRVVTRTCEVMAELKTDDPEKVRAAGAIDLQTLQKYLNFHYSVSLDLFGQEVSTNAANYYTAGLKGRFEESKIEDDHVLKDDVAHLTMFEDGAIKEIEYNALLAVNERLRDDYVTDCQLGVSRWNKVMRRHKVDFELKLPHRGFHRSIGTFSEGNITPEGEVISKEEWKKNEDKWLPSQADREFVISLQSACIEPGKIASWVAPPSRGIDGHPFDYEYVRFG